MSAKNTSVSLGDHMLSFAQKQVATGRYSSTSDVVRAGLRLLEEHESRVQALREALIAGENIGESTPFDFDVFIAAKRAQQPAASHGTSFRRWRAPISTTSGTTLLGTGVATRPRRICA